MTHTEILKQVAEKGSLIGQCVAVWYKNRKTDKNGKIYVLECAEMCEFEWVRKLWGPELVRVIRSYAKNYRGERKPNSTKSFVMGPVLKNIRHRKGVKQVSLATSSGISQGFISKIEKGNLMIPTDIAEKIASALRVQSKEFVKLI